MSDDDNHEGQGPDRDYEVGYGKPPKGTRFKPGQSGNPKGRQRRPKSTQQQMQTILRSRITVSEGGQSKRLTLQEVMLRSIANKAAKGELRAASFVMNLIQSAEAAESELIDQSSLSPEDQALFEKMLAELTPEAETNAESDVEPAPNPDPMTNPEKERPDETSYPYTE